jgi:hypothetical protein
MESSPTHGHDPASGQTASERPSGHPATPRDGATPASPRLWNPTAAVLWSVFFTPAFGALLHSANWRALGKPDRASINVLWVAATLVFLVIRVVAIAMTGSKTVVSVMRLVSIGLLVGWYSTQGKPQETYVSERYGDSYTRRSWVMPIVAGLGGAGLYALTIFLSTMALAPRSDQAPTTTAASDPDVYTITYLIRESIASFDMRDDGSYHLSDVRMVVDMAWKTSEGEPSVHQETSTDLPDGANGEYDRRRLRQTEDGRTMLAEEARVASGGGRFIDQEAEYEMEYVEGDWTRFMEGGDVVLRYSETARRDAEANLKNFLGTAILEGIQSETEAAEPVRERRASVVIDHATVSDFPNATFVANRRTIRSTSDGPINVEYVLKKVIATP